jgi:uncharacterized membrane protein YbhN (UPF0104 family)
VSAARKAWNTAWRAAVGAILLLWIFHSIFVNEAREQANRVSELRRMQRANKISEAEQTELLQRTAVVKWPEWKGLPRIEQWRLGWRHGPGALWQSVRSIEPSMFAVSLVLMGLTLLFGILRWQMVLRVQGFNLSFTRAAEISLVSHFFNSFLLGTAGGDVMKAYYAARETHHKKTEAVLTVFVDRVIGLWSMLLFAVVMIFPNLRLFDWSRLPGPKSILNYSPDILDTMAAVVGAMAVGATVFVILAFRGGVTRAWGGARTAMRRLPKGEWLERTLESCRTFGRDRGFITRTVGVSMALNAACVLQFYAVARGLHIDISPMFLFLIVPMVVAISALPISPAGLGVRENLFVQILALPAIGVAATPALSLSLLGLAGSLAWSLVGGVVYVLFKHKHHLAEQELATGE